MRSYILSTCGTSLIAKAASNNPILHRCANAKYLNKEDQQIIDSFKRAAREQLMNCSPAQVGRFSAELNAVVRYYTRTPLNKQDYHTLLCTDSCIGEASAELIKDWLTTEFQLTNVYVERRTDLQTKDLDSFRIALSELALWCEENLASFQHQDYHIVFNLNGGFKSVAGFMQSLAMIYADETIYVFESESELLRIPRLPIQLSTEETVRNNLDQFRRLAKRLDVQDSENIPETLIWEISEKRFLSAWGELVWAIAKKRIYQEQFWPPPCKQIRVASTFRSSINHLEKDRQALINERMDDLIEYLESGGERYKKRVDLKQLAGNPSPPSTHELDAWADRDARRIFCHYEDGILVLDKLDKGLH
jgi:putative CRISPR-associated protein (TIGR02619 family)